MSDKLNFLKKIFGNLITENQHIVINNPRTVIIRQDKSVEVPPDESDEYFNDELQSDDETNLNQLPPSEDQLPEQQPIEINDGNDLDEDIPEDESINQTNDEIPPEEYTNNLDYNANDEIPYDDESEDLNTYTNNIDNTIPPQDNNINNQIPIQTDNDLDEDLPENIYNNTNLQNNPDNLEEPLTNDLSNDYYNDEEIANQNIDNQIPQQQFIPDNIDDFNNTNPELSDEQILNNEPNIVGMNEPYYNDEEIIPNNTNPNIVPQLPSEENDLNNLQQNLPVDNNIPQNDIYNDELPPQENNSLNQSQIDPNTGMPIEIPPQIDPNTGLPIDPNTMMGPPPAIGTDIDPTNPVRIDDLKRLDNLKNIHKQLINIKKILAIESKPIYRKIEDKVNDASNYFVTIIKNLDSFTNQIDDIILKYKSFILISLNEIKTLRDKDLNDDKDDLEKINKQAKKDIKDQSKLNKNYNDDKEVGMTNRSY